MDIRRAQACGPGLYSECFKHKCVAGSLRGPNRTVDACLCYRASPPTLRPGSGERRCTILHHRPMRTLPRNTGSLEEAW